MKTLGKFDWVIVDGIGPFFHDYKKRRINWSKIPLAELPVRGKAADEYWRQVQLEMREFVQRANADGYTAVTLDDVAHLVERDGYEPELSLRVQRLQKEMRAVIRTIKEAGLKVLMTSDVIPMTERQRHKFAGKRRAMVQHFKALLDDFLAAYPEVDGVVLRLGEGDGKDVEGDLSNELFVRTAREANALLKELLEVFERRNRMLFCRTWTVGAYPVGDLIWHRKTIQKFLRGIDSQHFVLSLKYGESDFFRYLPLNKAFFETSVQKVIEFQARREYEGAGEYPCFIGWQVEEMAKLLERAVGLVGLSVWVQTGGWHGFRRRSYIGDGSFWVELNSAVTVQIMQFGRTVDEALEICFGSEKLEDARRFLTLSEELILKGLYVEEFAQQKWFFRRVRIPPLLHVYWESVLFQHPIKKVMRHFVSDGEAAIAQLEQAMEGFDVMEQLAAKLEWSVEDVRFMRDTFGLFALSREYLFRPFTPDLKQRILDAKKAYKKKYPRSERQRYRVKTNFDRMPLSDNKLQLIQRVFLRKKRGYRFIDHLLVLYLLGAAYRLFSKRYEKSMPKFARESAMGIETVLK